MPQVRWRAAQSEGQPGPVTITPLQLRRVLLSRAFRPQLSENNLLLPIASLRKAGANGLLRSHVRL